MRLCRVHIIVFSLYGGFLKWFLRARKIVVQPAQSMYAEGLWGLGGTIIYCLSVASILGYEYEEARLEN